MSEIEKRNILSNVSLGSIAPVRLLPTASSSTFLQQSLLRNSPSGSRTEGLPMWVLIMNPPRTRKPMEIVRGEVRRLEESLRENGVKWEKPVLTVDTLGIPAIPHLKITHQGYVNVKDRKILSVEV